MEKNNLGKRFHLFIIGGADIGKTFTAQELYHALVRLYNKDFQSDPLKKKRIIFSFTVKYAYMSHGVTVIQL